MTTTNSTAPCFKCNGRKVFPAFAHINEGKCFTCAGTGVVEVSNRPTTQRRKPVANVEPVRFALRRADDDHVITHVGATLEEVQDFANRLDKAHPDYVAPAGWILLRSDYGAEFVEAASFKTLWGTVAGKRRAQGLSPFRTANGEWSWC